LEQETEDNGNAEEVELIRQGYECRLNLVNETLGGDGVIPTEATRKKISNSNIRRFTDPNERLKTSIATRKAMCQPEVRAKITGRFPTQVTRLKMSLAQKTRCEDPVYRSVLSARAKGRTTWIGKKHKESSKQLMSEAKLGSKHTQAWKDEMSAKMKNRIFTQDHLDKLKKAWVIRRKHVQA
jgi:hypothetical protein